MATRARRWRTINSTCNYVDGDFGSDTFGNGSASTPYRTFAKAGTSKTIICRGHFSGGLNRNGVSGGFYIQGDYFGAAVFDGNFSQTLYGWRLANMIVKNDLVMPLGYGGVGCNTNTNSALVGTAQYVYGVAGSRVLIHNSPLYMGCVGGWSCKWNIYSKVYPAISGYKVGIGNGNYTPSLEQSTVYGIPIENRRTAIYGSPKILHTLFAKVDMIANDTTKFEDCLFAADCDWYWGTTQKLTVTGETSEERQASLLAAIAAKGTTNVTFTNCIFSPQTSDELMNDPEHLDFTLRPDSDAIRPLLNANGVNYIGAMPPAVRLPILDDSTGVAGTWDERSIDGCFEVVNGNICLNYAEIANGGKIMSKIVQINPQQVQYNGIWSVPMLPYQQNDVHLTSLDTLLDKNNPISEGVVIPTGWYRVHGRVVYNGTTYNDKTIIYVTAANTTFTAADEGSTLLQVVEPNQLDCVYCRCRATVYARVGVADDLQTGGVYLNDGEYPITYRNRTIAVGESFVAMNATDKFTCSDDSSQTIAVMFDDTRVPSAEWIPAQLFGEYFVSKASGTIEHDQFGVPISSGNYLANVPSSNGGFSDRLKKNIINQQYVQFALFAKYYGD